MEKGNQIHQKYSWSEPAKTHINTNQEWIYKSFQQKLKENVAPVYEKITGKKWPLKGILTSNSEVLRKAVTEVSKLTNGFEENVYFDTANQVFLYDHGLIYCSSETYLLNYYEFYTKVIYAVQNDWIKFISAFYNYLRNSQNLIGISNLFKNFSSDDIEEDVTKIKDHFDGYGEKYGDLPIIIGVKLHEQAVEKLERIFENSVPPDKKSYKTLIKSLNNLHDYYRQTPKKSAFERKIFNLLCELKEYFTVYENNYPCSTKSRDYELDLSARFCLFPNDNLYRLHTIYEQWDMESGIQIRYPREFNTINENRQIDIVYDNAQVYSLTLLIYKLNEITKNKKTEKYIPRNVIRRLTGFIGASGNDNEN